MLKKRLIPKLLLKRRLIDRAEKLVLVTSLMYRDFFEIGDPVSQAKIYEAQAADELLFLDLDRSLLGPQRDMLGQVIVKVAEEIFMPLTVGGGVQTLDDIRFLLLNGADKISINTSALENPGLINEAACAYGSQCVIVSIDFRKDEFGSYWVWANGGKMKTDYDPASWAIEAEKRGAGEILLSSIDRDGTQTGLELEVVRDVSNRVSIPVIASGGCGVAKHFIEGFYQGNADAVAAGTFFASKDQSPMQTRSHLKNAGIPIRTHF